MALDDTRRLADVSLFCHAIFPSRACMSRPSLPSSVLSRSLRPAGTSSCTPCAPAPRRSLPAPGRLSSSRSIASGRPQRPSRVCGAASALVKPPCPLRAAQPCLPGAMLNWARSPRVGLFGEEGLRIAEAVDLCEPGGCLVGERSAGPSPRRPARGAPPARTRYRHLSGHRPSSLFLQACSGPGYGVRPGPGVLPTPWRCLRRRWHRPWHRTG